MNAPSPSCYMWLSTLTKNRTIIKRYIRISTLVLLGFFVINGKAFAVADPELPDEICAYLLKEIGAHIESCPDSNLTEENTKAKYEDLNGDGTKEVILVSGGGSCGSNYWVFKLNKKIKWENIGGWCGCGDGLFKVKNTKHNGYRDIWTCGKSGFYNGTKYVGQRQ